MNLPSGIPTNNTWRSLLNSDIVHRMEVFSSSFLTQNEKILDDYGSKWVRDPLHQWSRLWEYPFAYDRLATWRSEVSEKAISVLDAGSGITFFPYFLATSLPSCKVTCCDVDCTLADTFTKVESEASGHVTFDNAGLEKLPFSDSTFDAAYCISVLEHMDDSIDAIEEIARVLKPNGVFVMTFDISLDGKADIPVARAAELVSHLQRVFSGDAVCASTLQGVCDSDEILTTTSAALHDPSLLPWRLSQNVWIARVLRGKSRIEVPKVLTVYGEAYTPFRSSGNFGDVHEPIMGDSEGGESL